MLRVASLFLSESDESMVPNLPSPRSLARTIRVGEVLNAAVQ